MIKVDLAKNDFGGARRTFHLKNMKAVYELQGLLESRRFPWVIIKTEEINPTVVSPNQILEDLGCADNRSIRSIRR